MAKPGPRFSANSLFKRVQGFHQFETGARAFLDVTAVVKVARTRSTEFSKLLTDLGMEGVRSWTFYSGFDGSSERALSELEMPGPRQGLLRLLSGKPFTLHDVPPLRPMLIAGRSRISILRCSMTLASRRWKAVSRFFRLSRRR